MVIIMNFECNDIKKVMYNILKEHDMTRESINKLESESHQKRIDIEKIDYECFTEKKITVEEYKGKIKLMQEEIYLINTKKSRLEDKMSVLRNDMMHSVRDLQNCEMKKL